jgi:ATP-dependent DNA helicase RecG
MAGRPLSYLASLPVDAVKGIGPASARKLGEAGIHSVADLLLHVPRRYLDRSQLFDLAAVPLNEEVTVAGRIESIDQRDIPRRGKRRLKITEAAISDGTSYLHAVWFNPYLKLREGAEVALSGKVERFRGKLQMKSPDFAYLEEDSLITGRVVPIHPSAGGLTAVKLRSSIDNALRRSRPIQESVPGEILSRLDLVDRDTAIANVHFPETREVADAARERLVFDELFRLEVALAMQKHIQMDDAVGVAHLSEEPLVTTFLDALPYDLTGAQNRVIGEITSDLAQPHPMHRLLQGEVGSGKTVVAVAAMLRAIQSGSQGAVMAPTEVLAEQHYLGIKDLLETAGLSPDVEDRDAPDGMESLFTADSDGAVEQPMLRLALLTSNNSEVNFLPVGTARRADVMQWIGDGTIDLVVGTHALIQDELRFDRLGAAVVDEQHRFGVYQRVSLREKATDYDPDLLIMTATPIPRTLAMTLYGDLDVSELDEMPPGRTPVETVHVYPEPESLASVYEHIRREVAGGRQAFVVCPLVDESDKLQVASATSEYERLQTVFPDLRLGLLHGQLRPADKDGVMTRFRNREIDVLVATTVIEVGIDIPNATVMVIEDADRFGLSQLHQLRGRVGRGAHASRCVLISDPTTEEGRQRLAAMVASNDGFRLAEEDLRIRGQGTVFGTRQAGMKDLKLADILRDAEMLIAARREAFGLVRQDPQLKGHPELAEEIRVLLGEDVEWLFKS